MSALLGIVQDLLKDIRSISTDLPPSYSTVQHRSLNKHGDGVWYHIFTAKMYFTAMLTSTTVSSPPSTPFSLL